MKLKVHLYGFEVFKAFCCIDPAMIALDQQAACMKAYANVFAQHISHLMTGISIRINSKMYGHMLRNF